jgi:nicotinate phosphoribosyltransferase
VHPCVAPVVERAAYIGGCDGVATLLAAERLGISASGTMPHSLVLLMGSTEAAARAFHKSVDPQAARIALIDTFNDEKFEAVRVAEALGPDLYAIRLDTPASRRGNFREILQEVRWELDLRGFEHVRLFASGGLTESAVESLSDLVDGFGVGTEISAAPVVDFSMDIVEIDGEPIAKRGKMSGSKSMWRCATCGAEFMTPRNHRPEHEHDTVEDLVQPLLDRGGFVSDLPTPSAIRQRVLDALDGEELV